jgi:hypothetical protein
MTGFSICKLALVDAKALEAKTNAKLKTTLLENVAIFMTAPFSFPLSVGKRLGAARLTARGESTLSFTANRLQFNRWGSAKVQRANRKACLALHKGFLTWAAKPKVKKSLNPAKNS